MKIFLIGVIALALTGCSAMPHSVAHKYPPTPHPELAGHWIGSATGQTHTMLLRPDGTGDVCWEAGTKYNTTPVTISGDKIITMMASDLKINPDGTFSQCKWGICIDFKRTNNIPAACREWLKN